jgi:hypothetical protein
MAQRARDSMEAHPLLPHRGSVHSSVLPFKVAPCNFKARLFLEFAPAAGLPGPGGRAQELLVLQSCCGAAKQLARLHCLRSLTLQSGPSADDDCTTSMPVAQNLIQPILAACCSNGHVRRTARSNMQTQGKHLPAFFCSITGEIRDMPRAAKSMLAQRAKKRGVAASTVQHDLARKAAATLWKAVWLLLSGVCVYRTLAGREDGCTGSHSFSDQKSVKPYSLGNC